MMTSLMTCFGWTGILSGAAWLAAAGMAIGARRRVSPERRLAAALGVAVLGAALASWHAARVADFRLDQSDEIRAARAAQQQAEGALERARARTDGEVSVRFAEDDAGAVEPAYRKGGKQRRDAGKVRTDTPDLAPSGASGDQDEPSAAVSLRLPDYELANRLNRANWTLSRLVLLVILGVLLWDYLKRFNDPERAYAPLPIAAWGMDHLPGGPLRVTWDLVQGQDDDAGRKERLATIIRQGRSFVYFGDQLESGGLPLERWHLGRWRACPARLLRWGDTATTPRDPEFVLDGAWFGRQLLWVPPGDAAAVLAALTPLLEARARLRARARGVPHMVWEDGLSADDAMVERFAKACAATGIRFVRVVASPCVEFRSDDDVGGKAVNTEAGNTHE